MTLFIVGSTALFIVFHSARPLKALVGNTVGQIAVHVCVQQDQCNIVGTLRTISSNTRSSPIFSRRQTCHACCASEI